MNKDERIKKEQGERLALARKAAGYRSAREAALENRWPESSYRAHEGGTRTIGQDDAERYARRFSAAGIDVSAKSILFGSEDDVAPPPRNVVKVMGYIGAGASIEPEFEQVPADGLFEVELPFPIPDETIGLQIRGDSMLPYRQDGDVIVVWRDQRRATRDYVGKTAAVRTESGGRFYKRILNGSRRGHFNLFSFNAGEIENVRLAWVGEVCAEVPRDQVRQIERATRSKATRLANGRRRAGDDELAL